MDEDYSGDGSLYLSLHHAHVNMVMYMVKAPSLQGTGREKLRYRSLTAASTSKVFMGRSGSVIYRYFPRTIYSHWIYLYWYSLTRQSRSRTLGSIRRIFDYSHILSMHPQAQYIASKLLAARPALPPMKWLL